MGSPYHGKSIEAHFGATQLTNVRSWSVDLAADIADSTSASSSNTGKEKTGGLIGGTASVVCKVSGDAQITEGAEATLELLRSNSNSDKGYAGTAICTGISINATIDGTEEITYNFTFSGTVTGTVTKGV